MKDKFTLKKASIITIAVVVISLALLAIPGQFYDLNFIYPSKVGTVSTMSGYEFITNILPETFKSFTGVYGIGPSALGIAALVMLGLAGIGAALRKVSSACPLFGAVFGFIGGLFFLCMQPWGANPMFTHYQTSSAILWVSYVIGTLLILAAVYTTIATVYALKAESKSYKSSSTGYSYLKK